jgi:hypothetical protein
MIRLVALLYLLKHLAQMLKYFAAFSGSSLAIFAAIRRASSLVSSLACLLGQ